ncbi:MAG: hypothetical protein M3081_18030 [Gemmatimonadota bacterium]|nr:hypothetical protein [Gemmatimonadota bacterium]
MSRKTPRDGKLEITAESATQLGRLADLQVAVGATRGAGRVASMPCTCRGQGDAHVHWFLESDSLKALVPGDTVTVALGTDGSVSVTAA